MNQESLLISAREAAQQLGITPHAVRAAANRGVLPAVRRDPYLFWQEDVTAYARRPDRAAYAKRRNKQA